MLAAIANNRDWEHGAKSALVDKAPFSLYWPEKSSSVMTAASLLFATNMLFGDVYVLC